MQQFFLDFTAPMATGPCGWSSSPGSKPSLHGVSGESSFEELVRINAQYVEDSQALLRASRMPSWSRQEVATSMDDDTSAFRLVKVPSLAYLVKSVGQQTESQFVCSFCSERTNPPSESFMLDADPDNNAASQASTVRMPEIDLSEDITSKEEAAHLVDATCSTSPLVILVESQVQTDPEQDENEATIVGLRQRLRHDRTLVVNAICVCRALKQRLSHLQVPDAVIAIGDVHQPSLEKYPLGFAANEEFKELNGEDPFDDHMTVLSLILQQLGDEAERITAIFDHLKQADASSPAGVKTMEAERKQLQEELDRRMAECNSVHSRSIAQLENAREALMVKLTAAETRSTQLGTELDAMTQRFRATDRFLNEQLQEREQEREEFQARIDLLSAQTAELKNVITALKRERATSPNGIKPLSPRPTENGFLTPDSSQMKPNSPAGFVSSLNSLPEPPITERIRPPVKHAVNGGWQDTSNTYDGSGCSDVDEALSFELMAHPRRCSSPSAAPTLEIRPSTVNLHSQVNHQRSSLLSPQRGESKIDACMGDSSVKYVDTGVSPMSPQAFPSTSENGVYCNRDFQLAKENTSTNLNTCATLGLISAETIHVASDRSAKLDANHTVLTDDSTGNSALNLSLEMRHVTLMQELRTALSKVEALLAEHEQEGLQCDPATKRRTLISPAVTSDAQRLHQVIRLLVEDLDANIKIFIDGMSNLYEEERQRSCALEKSLSITRADLDKKEEQLKNAELFVQVCADIVTFSRHFRR
ncbi:unnamed protein product [Schistocephalus solidus]|uniref:FYVE-type domain-containing protein n=1 Tax=Schistocephalus solidus TaxID=70667 RepID=A0A183TB15_SCHSO|nr:unnamed protein product [Schistocephalus solidus]